MPPNHLYIHVPFCARRCSYCDFSIAVRSTTPVEDYLNAIRTEASQVIQGSWALDTVYLGGGHRRGSVAKACIASYPRSANAPTSIRAPS